MGGRCDGGGREEETGCVRVYVCKNECVKRLIGEWGGVVCGKGRTFHGSQ
jgi:hypothetical protein